MTRVDDPLEGAFTPEDRRATFKGAGQDVAADLLAWVNERLMPTVRLATEQGDDPQEIVEECSKLLRRIADELEAYGEQTHGGGS